MLQHVTHNYIINFVEGLFPLESEAYCGYTSLQEYVITMRGSLVEPTPFSPKLIKSSAFPTCSTLGAP